MFSLGWVRTAWNRHLGPTYGCGAVNQSDYMNRSRIQDQNITAPELVKHVSHVRRVQNIFLLMANKKWHVVEITMVSRCQWLFMSGAMCPHFSTPNIATKERAWHSPEHGIVCNIPTVMFDSNAYLFWEYWMPQCHMPGRLLARTAN